MNSNSKKLSFEFFPTKTNEGRQKLGITRQQLKQFKPDFFSCTYGAGGSTRAGTLQIIQDILIEQNTPATPHLACIGSSAQEVKELVDLYKKMGIQQILCLRGDIPSGIGIVDGFTYASELVSFIKNEYQDTFKLIVAAYPEIHPQARSADDDIQNFIHKCKVGADSAITQYFYNIDAYFYFLDEIHAKGIDIPIVPGIMPIASFSKLARFSDSCGAEIPRWLKLKLQSYADDTASIKALGLDFITNLCDRLLQQGAPGLHFYTLNQAGLVSTICERLGY
ncbi:MAG: methylenetetrahydrofolate reductase [NAD(P)H] [Neisseriaceae bacterium]|nr:MAG: methylenetetrahydrofolate reductase [NAD(P)H] [Neisseriaceae bacterium]